MEKGSITVVFKNEENGKEIKMPIKMNEDGSMDLNVDFGKDGENHHVNELHHRFGMIFFNTLMGMSDVQSIDATDVEDESHG